MFSLKIAEYMKIIGKIIKIITLIFLLYILLNIVSTLLYYQRAVVDLSSYFLSTLSNIILLIIIAYIGDKIEEFSIATENDMETKIIGYVESAKNTSVDTLAKHLNIPSNKIMDLIAKIKAKGGLIEYVIDLNNGNIRYEEKYSFEGTRIYATKNQEQATKTRKKQ